MNRVDQIGLDVPDTLREWSISDKTWGAAVLPFCDATKDLLDSMRNGRRRPVNNPDGNLESVDPFKEITYFEPSHCQYHFYNSDQSCSIYSHFSNVLMIGDSLTRHMEQALFQIFTGDFKSGSIPRLSNNNLAIYSQCVCDGIFSENRVCRDYSMTMQKMAHSHAYGICTKYPAFRIIAFPESYDLCDDDDRPRILFVNVMKVNLLKAQYFTNYLALVEHLLSDHQEK